MNLTRPTLKNHKKHLLFPLFSMAMMFSAPAQETPHQLGEKPSASFHQGTILNLQEGVVDLSKGHWNSSLLNGTNCIKFRGEGSDTWNISKCFDLGIFDQKSGNIAMLTRESGTLILTGELDPNGGWGRYSFTPDDKFSRFIKRSKIAEPEDDFLLPLFLGDMDSGFIDFLTDHYGSIKATELTELALHDVTLDDFKEYLSLYREYANREPSLEDMVATKINGINREYVDELQEVGYPDLNLEQMMEARAHGITAETVRGFASAGFENIPMEKLLETKVLGLTPATAVHLQEISSETLSLEAVLQLQVRGVNGEFLAQLRTAGFGALSLEEVLQARIHNLTPAFMTALDSAGVERPRFDQVIAARAQGVDTAFLGDLRRAELGAENLQEITTAKQYGVKASAVETWSEAGIQGLGLQDLVQAKIHGVEASQIREFQELGVEVWSLKELLSARIHGVDLAYIEKVRTAGGEQEGSTDAAETEDAAGTAAPEAAEQDSSADAEGAAPEGTELSPVPVEATTDGEPIALTPLHEFISLKLEEEARQLRETREQQALESDEATEAEGRDMLEIDISELEK